MNVKVQIPVRLGGYTGQRDQWESSAQDYTVTLEDDIVTLTADGPVQRQVSFKQAELAEALDFLRSK